MAARISTILNADLTGMGTFEAARKDVPRRLTPSSIAP